MATLDYRQRYQLARSVGLSHERAVLAVAISQGESGGRTDAVGDTSLTDATWGPSVGLWQIRSLNSERGTGRSRDASRLTDPGFNARSMAAISGHGSDFSPWSVYTSGAYRQYVDDVRAAVGTAGENPPGSISVGAWADIPGPLGDLGIPSPGDAVEGAAQQVVEWVAKPALIATVVAAGFAVIAVGLWRATSDAEATS